MLQGQCLEGKVFPGNLHFSLTFEPEMSNPNSDIFHKTANDIIAKLKYIFKESEGYVHSTVLKLSEGSVVATVNNVFKASSPATQQSTQQTITAAIKNGTINATFTPTSLCDQNPCDTRTTECNSTDTFPICSCMPGYVLSGFSSRSCIACPSGQKAEGQNCVPCAFGYSGFNCNDSALLALVVVAVVLGAILLILVLALIIFFVFCRTKHVSHTSSPYSPDKFQTWPAQPVTPIPRASLARDAKSEPYGTEMPLPDSRKPSNGLMGSYDLMQLDDMKTFKGKNAARYSYLVEGHENPYFSSADEQPSSS